MRLIFVLALLTTTTVTGAAPAHAEGDGAAADTVERFFGAVQSIYNPTRAVQAGVQWERLIFPWSLIQEGGPASRSNASPSLVANHSRRDNVIHDDRFSPFEADLRECP